MRSLCIVLALMLAVGNMSRGQFPPHAGSGSFRGSLEEKDEEISDEEVDHSAVRGKILIEHTKKGDFSTTEEILHFGAHEFFDDESGNTPLLYAILHDDAGATKALIEHGFDLMHVNKDGYNSIHLAALHDKLDMIRLLLEYASSLEDVQDYFLVFDCLEVDGKYSANVAAAVLEIGIAREDIGIIMHAVQKGIDINSKSESGYSALLMAVSDGDEVAVEELLKHGADANVFENDGWSALMFAAHLESPNKIIGLLLEAGADPLALNKAGDSALTLAREENNTRAYDLLMAATATRVEEDEVL